MDSGAGGTDIIRNAKPGDRVSFVNLGKVTTYNRAGEIVAHADSATCTAGTVVRRVRKYVVVKFDPPGIGEDWFRPGELIQLMDGAGE